MITAFGILFGFLAVLLPFVSLTLWMFLFTRIFRYSREGFLKTIFLRGWGTTARYVSLGFVPIFITASSLLSAGISIVLELVFAIIVGMMFSAESAVPEISVGMSAGPIEESAKFLCAALIYMTIFLVWKKRPQQVRERNRVKDGMIIGLLAGTSFGLFESILYMFAGFGLLLTGPMTFSVLDPMIWRFVFGVSIHALWTGISSTGLGRSKFGKKALYTSIFLSISIFFHALNNGIITFIHYGLEMQDMKGMIISDTLQLFFIILGFVTFILVWRNAGKHDPEQKM